MKHGNLPRLTARKHGRTPSEAYREAMSDSSILCPTPNYPARLTPPSFLAKLNESWCVATWEIPDLPPIANQSHGNLEISVFSMLSSCFKTDPRGHSRWICKDLILWPLDPVNSYFARTIRSVLVVDHTRMGTVKSSLLKYLAENAENIAFRGFIFKSSTVIPTRSTLRRMDSRHWTPWHSHRPIYGVPSCKTLLIPFHSTVSGIHRRAVHEYWHRVRPHVWSSATTHVPLSRRAEASRNRSTRNPDNKLHYTITSLAFPHEVHPHRHLPVSKSGSNVTR